MARLTDGKGLSAKQDKGLFGLPETGLVYSVRRGAADRLLMRFEGEGELTREISVPFALKDDDKVDPWPLFIRVNAETPEQGHAFLLGVVIGRSHGYSGGGASEGRLHLFRVDNPGSDHGRATEVLSLPLAGDKLIRACFSEKDEAARQGVCHDSFKFEATLSLDTANRGKWPVLIYQSKASARPGPLAMGSKVPDRPLTAEELQEKDDFACGFRRTIRFNPMSLHYEMESPGPDCTDYFLDD